LSRLENVPALLLVVLPNAVRETLEVWTEAEIVIVDAACPMPIPAPAETDKAPLDALRRETLLSALLEALIVRVKDATPLALASEILFPPTKASEIAPPVTEVPPPLID
jgi:hypothetical protein